MNSLVNTGLLMTKGVACKRSEIQNVFFIAKILNFITLSTIVNAKPARDKFYFSNHFDSRRMLYNPRSKDLKYGTFVNLFP